MASACTVTQFRDSVINARRFPVFIGTIAVRVTTGAVRLVGSELPRNRSIV